MSKGNLAIPHSVNSPRSDVRSSEQGYILAAFWSYELLLKEISEIVTMSDHLIAPDDFARRFGMRAGSLMWFLGAGASASAGIPTAWHMIWEFKQRLFVSQRKVSLDSVADLSNERIRKQIQAHIDSGRNLPRADTPDEYAELFEAVFPSESDRRSYLDSKLSGAKPSYGHLALATLMRANLTKLVWTTNFDPLVADAAARLYDSTGPLSVVDLDAPDLAAELIGDERWPIEIKIHGDFRSRRLKNTGDELRHQDSRLRNVLVDSCRRFGLVVAGYSGRDDSVMDALEEAISDTNAFPSGLFWLQRGDGAPYPRVTALIDKARKAGIESGIVPISNFDEVIRDLIRNQEGLDTADLEKFASSRVRWSPAPRLQSSSGWPVVRLNGIPVVETPSVCRLVDCDIGGWAETRNAVVEAGVEVITARRRQGVLCFGSDRDVRLAFESHNISNLDLYAIETRTLRYESAEQSLLTDAITAALSRERDFDVYRRRGTSLLAPKNTNTAIFSKLQRLIGELSGSVKNHPHLRWREGIGVRLEWASGQLWLIIEPTTVFESFEDTDRAIVADFSRERVVRRYNKDLNEIISFWVRYIVGNGDHIKALGISDGVDASFKFSSVTAYSRRVTA